MLVTLPRMKEELAVRTPVRQLEQWLQAKASENHLFQVERTIEVFERLAKQMTSPADYRAYRELAADERRKAGAV